MYERYTHYITNFIAYSSNTALSDRLDGHEKDHNEKLGALYDHVDSHAEEHDKKHSVHSQTIHNLGLVHAQTSGRVDGVRQKINNLKGNVTNNMSALRGELEILLSALDKAGRSLSRIKTEVESGMSSRNGRLGT